MVTLDRNGKPTDWLIQQDRVLEDFPPYGVNAHSRSYWERMHQTIVPHTVAASIARMPGVASVRLKVNGKLVSEYIPQR